MGSPAARQTRLLFSEGEVEALEKARTDLLYI